MSTSPDMNLMSGSSGDLGVGGGLDAGGAALGAGGASAVVGRSSLASHSSTALSQSSPIPSSSAVTLGRGGGGGPAGDCAATFLSCGGSVVGFFLLGSSAITSTRARAAALADHPTQPGAAPRRPRRGHRDRP